MSNALEQNHPNESHREQVAELLGTVAVPVEVRSVIGEIPRTFRVIQGGESAKSNNTLDEIWGTTTQKASSTNRRMNGPTIG